ncbi:rhomboid family intramembrane serine protease [Flavobacterium collinsii]|uniref:Rhomboid protease GlpG n=1 Tax=Flavobacterium collinsii TaxID=1114861 RepID=A0A9W4X6A3_9FLAO|nr:rhomboid family intramembrane serine protease [Flavobacterium collinsii]CAA9197777.1 Rhomboid protease GlpG [Flavobacterium collinsii]CAI2766950.1 Rhomboid protease GlpG [Flavobacterium collinsii]
METYLTKLKHILPTFIIIAFSTIVGLYLFRWIFVIQYDIIDIKEEVWCLWLPMGLPWIPILIWLRPRFRILIFKKDNDNGRFFFQILSAGTIIACLMVSQSYLTTATGKLQKLSTITDIEKVEKSRYYKVEKFSVAKYYGGSYTDFRQSGKYNQYLNFHIFFVTPIVKNTLEKINTIPKYWYGVDFNEQISNKISNEEKENKYEVFYAECIEKMNKYDFQSLDHFERIPTSDDRINYLKAIESRIKQKANKNFIVLEPIKEKFEERNGNKFAWIFGSFGIGIGVLLFSLIWPRYSETERKRFLSGKKQKQDDLVDMLNYLVPKGDHFATSVILDLNILVFLLMVFSGIDIISPNGIELLEWGGNRRLETTGGEWWRLLTSMFLHGGIMHLILNISGLVIAAIFVEPLLGRKKYFILYILCGLCGSLASIWWYSNTTSVGASGAIFGLYGAILGLLLTNAFPVGDKKGILIMIGIYVGINLLWGLTGGIDNAAHIGGLLSGALIGIVLYKLDEVQKNGI